MTTTELHRSLESLQDEYTYRVNLLLDEGREDLATALAEEYIAAATAFLQRTGEPALN